MNSELVTGWDAIEIAARRGVALAKYADELEEARENLTVEEAREVARQDPGLIYLPRRVGDGGETRCGDILRPGARRLCGGCAALELAETFEARAME